MLCFHCGYHGQVVRYCIERKAIFDLSRAHRQNAERLQTVKEYCRPITRGSSQSRIILDSLLYNAIDPYIHIDALAFLQADDYIFIVGHGKLVISTTLTENILTRS
ncbi:hypothetical protein AVEN_266761-1 [Araneus ventricosus]|uniref:CCHC-type domain-containing protein n=1 Tax=Araneus ventricosus TaxID=182803 RepID=A0A4Y2L6J6_ARAVE|nr:hypothetical protein AVEN_266761-1 [Araneus ventricosus]